jgi:glycoside/pentoside/hexuronide:cation symporter, GPH family
LQGPVAVLQWAIYTDTADYGEWKTGRRATGLIMSASLFAIKFGVAVGGAVIGWALAYYGFVANQQQTVETLQGIRLLMSAYPAIAGFVGGIIMLFYPLTNNMMIKIENDLQERRKEA